MSIPHDKIEPECYYWAEYQNDAKWRRGKKCKVFPEPVLVKSDGAVYRLGKTAIYNKDGFIFFEKIPRIASYWEMRNAIQSER